MFFESVLGIGEEEFRRDYFGQRHALFQASNSIASRFGLQEIDDYLTAWNGLLETFVLASLNGEAVHLPRGDVGAHDQKREVLNLYRAGATLKIDKLETRLRNVSMTLRHREDHNAASSVDA